MSEHRMTAAVPKHARWKRPLGLFSWALFDWANQPYFTLITTFIFAPYFASEFIGDPVRGQELWGYGLACAGILIAIFSPVLGAIADASGRRKPWLAVLGIGFVVSSSWLWTAQPGAPTGIWTVLTAAIVAAVTVEFAIVFNNSMLPGLVPQTQIGRLSGFGWGLGYLGGLMALVLVVSLPDAPLFGLPSAKDGAGRLVGPIAALWFSVFVIPLFLFTPDQPSSGLTMRQAIRDGLGRLAGTIAHARAYRNIGLFLIARMTYQDGLTAIFSFGGIYAVGVFGWDTLTLGIFGIILTVFAAIGAFAGGWADDRFGSRVTVLVSVGGLLIATVGAVSVDHETILFVIPVSGPAEGTAPLNSIAEMTYIGFGCLVGVFGGPAQAASRTLMARLAPANMTTEFFGLFALSGKATAFFAPLAIGITTGALGTQRAGMLVVIAFLAVGFLLLLPVREERSVPLN